jgi:hypothetical protein
MAVIAKSGVPSLSTLIPPQANTIVGLSAGEDIAAGDPCYIKNDGLVYRSDGTAANAAAKVDGWATIPVKAGEAMTLVFDVNMRYGAGLTPGARVYLGVGAAVIGDAATTGGTAPIGFVIDASRIRCLQSRY